MHILGQTILIINIYMGNKLALYSQFSLFTRRILEFVQLFSIGCDVHEIHKM